MAAAYTKQFLVDAYLSRYVEVCKPEELAILKANAEKLYDRVSKDKFRQYASLDPAAIKKYKNGSK